MKKRNFNSLPFKKERISTLTSSKIKGGLDSKKCVYSHKTECKTLNGHSDPFVDCTVTYLACVTEPRFCGLFGQEG
ncbi:hypothetical protein C8N46_10353 [Kordia periserrulae]|uniref:Uncharacterized protein n=1 Tax=Kordia periserrulae TaxID=701523 RepID=A0A2T6C0W6_9FLAO|nr:hypothetical protein [Kordia periserrulae]PTX61956.1 hypothetical protein C8N46_10353 [Kordia periserrulae]